MNIIFLDVDGVLNSMPYFEWLRATGRHRDGEFNEIRDYHLEMLAKVYHTCDAKIVLSSSWREIDIPENKNVYPQYLYLANSLKKYDMEIIDKTPVVAGIRPLEIVTWLKGREDKDDIRFVSFDDEFSKEDYDMFGIGSCLISTKNFCDTMDEGGIQQEHVNKAIEILNKEDNHGESI